MATKAELIAPPKTEEEITGELNTDSVTYQTIEGLNKSIGLRLCTACLNGKYPTNISACSEEFERIREKEKKNH